MRRVHVPKNVSVKPPKLVAHRGYALRYPENTLPSLRAAIEAGARYIEFDVQMTADGVPVLLHDADLWRTGRLDKKIHDMSIDQVMQVEVTEETRLGGRFTDVNIPLLGEIVDLLQAHPEITAFVELKRASLARFGVEKMVDRVLLSQWALTDLVHGACDLLQPLRVVGRTTRALGHAGALILHLPAEPRGSAGTKSRGKGKAQRE